MDRSSLELIAQLLRNYDDHLRDKAEHTADMMADWADASQSETIKYAEKYSIIRIERQRVRDSLFLIDTALKAEMERQVGADNDR